MTTLKQASELMATRNRFYTATLRGEWETVGYPTPETFLEAFVIRSYGVEIARITTNGEVTLNPKRYSVTTSKHLNIVKRAWGLI